MLDILLRYKTVIKYFFWIWLILIFVFSSYPKMPFQGVIELEGFSLRLDYVIHFLAYFILVLLFMCWRGIDNSDRKIYFFLFSILFGIIISSLNEVIQLFIPGRRFNPVDLLYNYLGIATGVLIFYLLIFRRLEQVRK